MIKFFKDRHNRVAEPVTPVERAAPRCRAAILIHPIHAILVNQPDQTLGQLLDGLVERLAWAVSVLPECGVLGLHDAGERAHQHAPFTGEITVHLILEGRGEQIARTNCHAHSQSAFQSTSSVILMHGIAAVDAATSEEIGSHAGS